MSRYSDEHQYAQPTGRNARLAGYAPLVRTKAPHLSRGERRELVSEIRRFEILRGCSDNDLVALVAACEPCSLPAGWAMVAEGTPADFCYVITKGTAGVYRGGKDIGEIGPGSLVGEMAILTGKLRSATVTTRSRVSGLSVDNATLLNLLAKRPSLLQALRDQFALRAAEAGPVLAPEPLFPARGRLSWAPTRA